VKTSLIIPTYNEEKTIKEVIEKSDRYADEIIVVDGASTDNTYNIIKNINDQKIKIIRHKKRSGVTQVRIDGMKKAENDIIIFVDADAQHNPGDIHELLKKIDQCDLVLGTRDELPRLGEKIMAHVCKVKDATTGFRIFKKSNLKEILKKEEYWGADTILRVKKQGLKICEVPIEVNERKHGKTTLTGINVFLKSLRFMIIVNLSTFDTLI